MSFPHAHKTIILLDHSNYFSSSSQYLIDVDNARSKVGFIPLAPIAKSLWTCNIEAVMEYCRIVYDLFGNDRLIRLSYTDVNTVSVNSWLFKEQNLTHVMNSLAQHSSPGEGKLDDDSALLRGLESAVGYLCEASELQQQHLQSSQALSNNGRIICLTHLKNAQYARVLEECVANAIVAHNKRAELIPELLPIKHCELTLLHAVPCGNDIDAAFVKSRQQVSPLLSSEVSVSQSGNLMANRLIELAVQHYNLASTTITGIPMKEEQNAGSSANYDVEILHSSEIHLEITRSGLADTLMIPSKEGLRINTVALKWCTPKSNAVELHPCSTVCRMTPVDVYSRPSTCLTNFLLAGRSVMLEQSRKPGTRSLSHMLSSHGNDLYIHTLMTSRCSLEDPPSISEGCGGRVTDYRISDFGRLSKECRLVPTEPSGTSGVPSVIGRAKRFVERATRIWPMTIGESVLFNNIQLCGPLAHHLAREHLTDAQLDECKKVVSKLHSLEVKGEPLPIVAAKIKGLKRDEQYRHLWAEVEVMLRTYADVSVNHQKVYLYLHDVRNTTPVMTRVKVEPPSAQQPVGGAAVAVKQEKPDLSTTVSCSNALDTESPESPPPPEKVARLDYEVLIPGEHEARPSLYTWWTARLKKLSATGRPDFAGRVEYEHSRAELYKHLKLSGNEPKEIALQ